MSWLLAFVGFSLLIILHEAGHFAAAKAVGMRVERFSLFFPPLLVRKKRGETEYAIGALPLGGYVKISGMSPDENLAEDVRDRAYHSQPVWKRIVVIAAGPTVNLVLALLLLLVFFWLVGGPVRSNEVGEVQGNFPATGVLKPGDKLIAVDGRRGGPREFLDQIATHKCAQDPPVDRCKATRPATLLVERNRRLREIKLTPIYDAQVKRQRLGFTYAASDERDPLPFGDAVDRSLDQFWFITRETLKLPVTLLDAEKRKEISGPVGSYEVTRKTIEFDLPRVVIVLAVISLSLAIINLFPFLPLDGGHIFWAIVEKVRRRPVPLSVMERAGFVGFALVAMIFLIGLTNDIGRLSGEGFNVR